MSVAAVVVSVWVAFDGNPGLGLALIVVAGALFLGAVVLQSWAERRGAVDRERQRMEEVRAERARWSILQWVAVGLALAAVAAARYWWGDPPH